MKCVIYEREREREHFCDESFDDEQMNTTLLWLMDIKDF